jgi:hypothetical protein
MSRDKLIIVGVVVLAGLGGLVYRQVKIDQSVGAPTTATADLPEIKGSEELDKISIINGDKPEVVLEKQNDKWMLTKPVHALANQQSVKSLIDNLKELKAKDVIALSADDALKKDYNLDAAHALHLVAYKGADKKLDEYFGKSGSRGQMVMVEGKPGVYAASGYSSYLYAKTASDWRDKEIFKFDDANASSVTVENKSGKFSFTKGEKWSGTVNGKAIERFDEDKLKSLLTTFKSLNADDFAEEGKTPADTGLDKPEGRVVITLKDNAGTYDLKVGKASTGSAHFAVKEGEPTVYTIGSTASELATADEKRFQKALATDAGAAKDGATSAAAPPHMPHAMPPGHP